MPAPPCLDGMIARDRYKPKLARVLDEAAQRESWQTSVQNWDAGTVSDLQTQEPDPGKAPLEPARK